VAEEELGPLLLRGLRSGRGEVDLAFEIRLRGAPGAKRISIEAGAPDSFRNECRPPSGTKRKSPGSASVQRSPSSTRTVPVNTKNDSEKVRWK
jgi:hypothetical protein